MRHLILGSGIAGLQAARAIRSVQRDSQITMLGREADPPYARPMISHFLEGAVDPVHPGDLAHQLWEAIVSTNTRSSPVESQFPVSPATSWFRGP